MEISFFMLQNFYAKSLWMSSIWITSGELQFHIKRLINIYTLYTDIILLLQTMDKLIKIHEICIP